MNFAQTNLCYLLWKDNIRKEKWATTLASWVNCSKKRAWELLADNSASMSDSELQTVCEIHGLSREDFQFSSYLERDSRVNVLQENLKWMLSSLPHGKKKEIATRLNRDQITISRWLKGGQAPKGIMLDRLKEAFGIPPSMDLCMEPVFLDPCPILDSEQKTWLRNRIDEISSEELQKLFPALQKILGKLN